MSMTLLIGIQFIGILAAYTILTVVLPAIVLKEKLKGRSMPERFLFSCLAGNFYLMNLVFGLQLLHISNRFTLIAGTIIPGVILWIRWNHIPVKHYISQFFHQLKKYDERKLGWRTILLDIRRILSGVCQKAAVFFRKYVMEKPLQWVFLAMIFGALFWIYGRQIFVSYGYTVSDIPVHLYWINAMEDNHIFVDGVYPFGFHAIIYYLHKVFEIDSYVLMRLFGAVQTIYIHIVLLVFLKLCCKSKYLPYAGVFFFVVTNVFAEGTYLRYLASLPQEYGMIFILPAIYYAFAFFDRRSKDCLVGFAMSFAMTLSAHFYDTMIAGLFCVGVAVGYFFRLFRKKYFWRILATVVISVIIAVLPMGIAFATGTPLQGSLNWGMSVIEGSVQEEETVGETEEIEETDKEQEHTSKEEGQQTDTDSPTTPSDTTKAKTDYVELAKRAIEKTSGVLDKNLFEDSAKGAGKVLVPGIALLICIGVFFWMLRQTCYGSMLVSTGVFMTIMTILIAAEELNIPALMDASRCSIYYAYMCPVVAVFLVDSVLYLISGLGRLKMAQTVVSWFLSAACVGLLSVSGEFKEVNYQSDYVTNEAIVCLSNIIREEEDGTWTIVSANDETQMAYFHGYHYEIAEFLHEMEEKGNRGTIEIPTKTVYFFIEKIPVTYGMPYEEQGQSISVKGALKQLPFNTGVNMYQGENRWITMSKMYVWAQKYHELYPNEMEVYLETDSFICYRIKQNMYHLYNFAIDYGYNQVQETEE